MASVTNTCLILCEIVILNYVRKHNLEPGFTSEFERNINDQLKKECCAHFNLKKINKLLCNSKILYF